MKHNNIKNQKNIIKNDKKNKKQNNEPFKTSIYNKYNFKKFCELKEEKTTRRICKNDLPPEFDEKLCDFINLFMRKTMNVKNEWEFYIDYENNEIIHCLHGKSTTVGGLIHSALMENKKILTIHNHIKGTYSAPSRKNFEILDHEFEDYEIICAEEEYWILEAQGKYPLEYVEKFKTEIEIIFQDTRKKSIEKNAILENYNPNEDYGNRIEEHINKQNNNIKLTKKEYR